MGVIYDLTVRAEDTERAAATLRPQLLPNGHRPRLVRLDGTCPRCGHSTTWNHRLGVVTGAAHLNDDALDEIEEFLDDEWPDSWDETIDAHCRCAHRHDGGPADAIGCGSNFRVRVVWP